MTDLFFSSTVEIVIQIEYESSPQDVTHPSATARGMFNFDRLSAEIAAAAVGQTKFVHATPVEVTQIAASSIRQIFRDEFVALEEFMQQMEGIAELHPDLTVADLLKLTGHLRARFHEVTSRGRSDSISLSRIIIEAIKGNLIPIKQKSAEIKLIDLEDTPAEPPQGLLLDIA